MDSLILGTYMSFLINAILLFVYMVSYTFSELNHRSSIRRHPFNYDALRTLKGGLNNILEG